MVFCLAAFSSAIMPYVTGLELTTLTNLLFIIIPQGYLPCAKLFMVLDESLIFISSDCVFCRLAGLALLYTIGVLFSRLIGKPSLNPATIAGFLLYNKKEPIAFGSFYCLFQGSSSRSFSLLGRDAASPCAASEPHSFSGGSRPTALFSVSPPGESD